MKWYFTFGSDERGLANNYVCFEGTFSETREKMFEKFGARWAFQYSEEDFKDQPEKYGLTQL